MCRIHPSACPLPPSTLDHDPPLALATRTRETLLLTGLFFLLAGSEPPGVNEAHYLSKAKHYWSPQWCAGDVFLESADAHTLFYWTFGRLTQWFSLPTAAWIGRFMNWLILAAAWQHLSWSVVPRRFASLLTAALFAAYISRFHMAGEWVIGGVEAKGPAFALVFLGLSSLVRGQWNRVWIFCGAGAAFHVLVGGWAVVAAMIAWLGLGRPQSLRTMLPGLLLGGALSLAGLVPCLLLNRGQSADVIAEGNLIYVYVRLLHHCVILDFEPWYLIRFAFLCGIMESIARGMRRDAKSNALLWFAAGSLVIALIGMMLELAEDSARLIGRAIPPETVAGVLRYYLYRCSDFAVPLTVAFVSVRFAYSNMRGAKLVGYILVFVAVIHAAGEILETRRLRLPEVHRPPGLADARLLREEQDRYRQWQACCAWINEKTPSDASFLTPPGHHTFKWFAQRPETVSWKDAPQDAAGLVDWMRRVEDVHMVECMHPPEIDADVTDNEQYSQRLALVAAKYQADYVVSDRRAYFQPQGFERVYPTGAEQNAWYEVYRVSPATAAGE